MITDECPHCGHNEKELNAILAETVRYGSANRERIKKLEALVLAPPAPPLGPVRRRPGYWRVRYRGVDDDWSVIYWTGTRIQIPGVEEGIHHEEDASIFELYEWGDRVTFEGTGGAS